MSQNTNPTPEQEAQAWAEFKQWYANCITAAPKPDADQEGITFGHIYRWCANWDIDASALDAICAKHNIPAQEHKRPLTHS